MIKVIVLVASVIWLHAQAGLAFPRHRASSAGPFIVADQQCTTPGTRDISCLTNAVAAAQASGSPIVLTCGQTYPYSGNFPSGVNIDAGCPGAMANNAQNYFTTIAFTASATIGPANGLSLHWINLSVPNGDRLLMSGIQQSTLDFSAHCGTGLGVTSTASTTAGSATITVTSATGIVVGAAVTSNGPIDGGTFVTAISGTTVTLSKNATATQASASVTFSLPCLELRAASNIDNFADNRIPNLMINTQSGSGLMLKGEVGYTTENTFGPVKISFNPPSPGSGMGEAVEFAANCDSNTFDRIGTYASPYVSYADGVVFGTDPTIIPANATDADLEVIRLIDSTGTMIGYPVVVNNSAGNRFNVGVINFNHGPEFLDPNQNVWFASLYSDDPAVNGAFWATPVDLNKLYRSGYYSSYTFTNGPPVGFKVGCSVYSTGAAVGSPGDLTVQDCSDLDAGGNAGRWWRRVSSGVNTWGPWQEMTNGWTPSGTSGVTSTTCTQWTSGLCTHN